jgi:hypothetical protein
VGCSKPKDAPTSDRAIPVIIFSAAPAVARAFLRRWTGEAASGAMHEPVDVREYLDWDYYRERLSSAIQKIITIPAAYQVRTPPSITPVNPSKKLRTEHMWRVHAWKGRCRLCWSLKQISHSLSAHRTKPKPKTCSESCTELI